MIPKVFSSMNPYELDYIKKGKNKIIALTRKNADFIEAVVKNLDSNYKIDEDVNNKRGSKYWFDQLDKTHSKENFKQVLTKCVESIDNINHTHLGASLNGRDKMVQIIFNDMKCDSREKLLKAVNVSLNSEIDEDNIGASCNKDTLFYKMLVSLNKCKITKKGKIKIYEKGKNKAGDEIYRNNISFASKFISYARKHLNKDCTFSKYDGVVSKQLPLYEEIYLGKTSCRYENNAKQESDVIKKQIKSFNTYIRYKNTISKILDLLKKEGIHLTEEEFDHIIWYTSKGKR